MTLLLVLGKLHFQFLLDRKKNIFKLAQGEYIAPEKIENVYATSKFVAQSFVYGKNMSLSPSVLRGKLWAHLLDIDR